MSNSLLLDALHWCKTRQVNSDHALLLLKSLKFGAASVASRDPIAAKTSMRIKTLWTELQSKHAGSTPKGNELNLMKQAVDEAIKNKEIVGFFEPNEDLIGVGRELIGSDVGGFIDLYTGHIDAKTSWSYDELEGMVGKLAVIPPAVLPKSGETTLNELVDTYGLAQLKIGVASEESLNLAIRHLADGLAGLAESLGLEGDERRKIGFDGKLAINVGLISHDCTGLCGARFGGGSEINLNGQSGWTALAHEWFHALDRQLATELTAQNTSQDPSSKTLDRHFLTELLATNDSEEIQTPAVSLALKTVLTSFKEGVVSSEPTPIDAAAFWKKEADSLRAGYFDRFVLPRIPEAERAEVEAGLDKWFDSFQREATKGATAEMLIESLTQSFNGGALVRYTTYIETEIELAIDKFNELEKSHAVSDFLFFAQKADERLESKANRTNTTRDGYTQSVVEMAARSFESAYVGEFFARNNKETPALTLADNPIRLYPQKEEKQRQFDVWSAAVPTLMAQIPLNTSGFRPSSASLTSDLPDSPTHKNSSNRLR
jgi:hypothetical protein